MKDEAYQEGTEKPIGVLWQPEPSMLFRCPECRMPFGLADGALQALRVEANQLLEEHLNRFCEKGKERSYPPYTWPWGSNLRERRPVEQPVA